MVNPRLLIFTLITFRVYDLFLKEKFRSMLVNSIPFRIQNINHFWVTPVAFRHPSPSICIYSLQNGTNGLNKLRLPNMSSTRRVVAFRY
jgi:hypothetical protein